MANVESYRQLVLIFLRAYSEIKASNEEADIPQVSQQIK